MLRARLIVALSAAAIVSACAGDAESEERSARASASQVAQLDTTLIPVELRPLTSLAAEWGIGDDDEREQKVAQSTPEERQALRAAVLPHDQGITDWLDSFGQGSAMTDEAAAFMYMRLAIEEMPEAE